MEQENKRARLITELEKAEISIEDFYEGARFVYSVLSELDIDLCFDIISGESDFYVMCTYYSSKIQKTIVLDYSVDTKFDSFGELADLILALEKEALELEAKLPDTRLSADEKSI